MEDNKTKQGESTPEEYLEKNTFQAFTGEGAISYIYPRSAKIALEMARKSEREKVIGIAIERLIIKKAKSSWNENYDFAMEKAIEILTNLKKEK
jgi:hypothetical protein